MTTQASTITTVGAGVFGLSTALHLSKQGYKDVTVFDYQPCDQNAYNPAGGCDGASADVNKIYRCSYGSETEYQDLAFTGRPIWLQWNRDIAGTPVSELPKGLAPTTRVFSSCGFPRMADGPDLSAYDRDCLEQLEKAGLRGFQHVLHDPKDMKRLVDTDLCEPGWNWASKTKLFSHVQQGRLSGYLDTSAGFTYADKACAWARHLCERQGVKFVLDSERGRLKNLVMTGSGEARKVAGIITRDGEKHKADVVVVACGGWTPAILPDVQGILEATAGSVITMQLPEERQDLWSRFAPENFPVWAYGLTGHFSPEFGGFYGFPRTLDGKLKIGYRGRKWVNYQTDPKTGRRLSVPKTKYTADRATSLPRKAIANLKNAVAELFPELQDLGICDTRMCWYTDLLDNSFVVDYVPGYSRTFFVAPGGSGHGFKFLPVLGKHIVNALEGKPDQFTPLWRWRRASPDDHANGLEEGEASGRNLADLEIAERSDWVFEERSSTT